MTWDGIKRRAEENGEEGPEVILARIDERVKNMNEKLIFHMVSFEEHKKEDDKNFSGLYKFAYIGVGAVGLLEILISVFKH